MKLSASGLELLAGIVATCMAKRGEEPTVRQLELLSRGQDKELSLEEFRHIFPLEHGTAERIVDFAQKIGRRKIDDQTVACFFGGKEHINYALNDISDQGVSGALTKILLVFHLLLPVEIQKDKKKLIGMYVNAGTEIMLHDIQALPINGLEIFVGQRVLVHYGYVICTCRDKKVYQAILDEQSSSSVFLEACSRFGSIDCGRLLRAFRTIKQPPRA